MANTGSNPLGAHAATRGLPHLSEASPMAFLQTVGRCCLEPHG